MSALSDQERDEARERYRKNYARLDVEALHKLFEYAHTEEPNLPPIAEHATRDGALVRLRLSLERPDEGIWERKRALRRSLIEKAYPLRVSDMEALGAALAAKQWLEDELRQEIAAENVPGEHDPFNTEARRKRELWELRVEALREALDNKKQG